MFAMDKHYKKCQRSTQQKSEYVSARAVMSRNTTFQSKFQIFNIFFSIYFIQCDIIACSKSL